MSARITGIIANERAENTLAYQEGNVAAPATTSHTSSLSENRPMVFMATRRSRPVLPTNMCTAPARMSKPSKMKNPVHKKALTANQKALELHPVL